MRGNLAPGGHDAIMAFEVLFVLSKYLGRIFLYGKTHFTKSIEFI